MVYIVETITKAKAVSPMTRFWEKRLRARLFNVVVAVEVAVLALSVIPVGVWPSRSYCD